jgi:SsrA-binding protein
MNTKKKPSGKHLIAENRRAFHDYFIEERFEAGLVLEGWEVKSLRASKVQLAESYVLLRGKEAWLFGAHIPPLSNASTHIQPDPMRSRKLLLHAKELSRFFGSVERKGYTLIPLTLYWKGGRAKLEIALARGKRLYDKRATLKERDWKREKAVLMKRSKNT